MRAAVTDECISCEACVDICPEVFAMEEGGKAYPTVNPIPEELQDKAKEARDSCPVEAIILEE
ncbi:MAG: ferredoxin [Armatimonadota bacterium]